MFEWILRDIRNGLTLPDRWPEDEQEQEQSEQEQEQSEQEQEQSEQEQEQICELCGESYSPFQGYYEPGEYSYCGDCCHW